MVSSRGLSVLFSTFLALLATLIPTISSAETHCDIQKAPCVFEQNEKKIVFDVSPRPLVPMKEFEIRVSVEGVDELPPKLTASFDMPGMMMGKNESLLNKVEGTTYEGKGFIVKCPSGKTLWRVRLKGIPGMDEVEFTFDVAE